MDRQMELFIRERERTRERGGFSPYSRLSSHIITSDCVILLEGGGTKRRRRENEVVDGVVKFVLRPVRVHILRRQKIKVKSLFLSRVFCA